MSNLKAWTQNPDQWRITYPRRKKTLLELLSPWLMVVGFVVFVMLCNWLVELI